VDGNPVCRAQNRTELRVVQANLLLTETLDGTDPFDYLTELLRHPAELTVYPAEWMPWNYRSTLEQVTRPAAA
jgi:transposase